MEDIAKGLARVGGNLAGRNDSPHSIFRLSQLSGNGTKSALAFFDPLYSEIVPSSDSSLFDPIVLMYAIS